ncbi:MAG: MFS transporter [Proteobacteria bacterium]|nr:MFS transporter [Pseudomonadota bacterium]
MRSIESSRNERRAVAVLSLGFGLVGIDRFLISTMYPTIARDLHLGYGDIGTITGVLALAWGLAALVMGNLSDRVGQRRVLTGSLVVFSLLIGASGLAGGLAGLVLVRVVMGFADGAYTPASIAATIHQSPPERHGRNVGLQQSMLVLFGLGLSPLLVGWLLREGMDWRYIFSLFVLPGLLLAWLTWRIIPDNRRAEISEHGSFSDWRTVLKYRNIRLLMGGMLCWLTTLITTSAFLPSYFVDHLKLDTASMGTVMSAIGFGAMVGTILLSAASDRLGRRPVMLACSVVTLGGLLLLGKLGPSVPGLFGCLFLIHFGNNTLITMTVGPVAAETVPPALMATASGVVIATGELLGGGLAPMVAGQVAERFGIEHILWLPIVMMALGVLLCASLKETRPAFRTGVLST